MKKNKEIDRNDVTRIQKLCKSRGLRARIAAFCQVDPSSNPLPT